MSIFKKLFGKKDLSEASIPNTSEFKTIIKPNFKNFPELIEQHAGLSFEKQLLFGDIVGSNSWELDMDSGVIKFGELSFPIQIIGSLSFNDSSWMWAWANKQSNMPESLLRLSFKLKALGEEKNIKELKEEHFNVEEHFEHKIGLAVCGLFKSKSYYCANYGQGTLVVLLDDDKIPAIDKDRIEKVTTNFPQLISSIELNHKNTFKNYLIDREFKLKISENKIEGIRNNRTVTGVFDELGRLINMKGKVY